MIDEGFNQIDIKLEREILLDIFRYFHDMNIYYYFSSDRK